MAEPFGYWCECKGADPVFLRKPAWIPPTDARSKTTPLYDNAFPAPERHMLLRALRSIEALPRHSREDDSENVATMAATARIALAASESEADRLKLLSDAVMVARLERRMQWQPIETAPVSKWVLLWWRPRDDPKYPHPADYASDRSNNKYAECSVIGQVCWHDGMLTGEKPNTWWNGQRQEEQDIWHITHWMPLPEPPRNTL